MSTSARSAIVSAVVGACLLSVVCGYDRQTVQEEPRPTPPRIVEPVSDDGEVFYFPATGDSYRASLSGFRKAHPELQCHYFGADEEKLGFGGGTIKRVVGHTIVCYDTAVNAQEETVP